LKTGNARPPSLAPDTVALAREAWFLAGLEHGSTVVRSGHLLLALVTDESLARLAADISPELRKVSPDALRTALPHFTSSAPDGAGSVTPAPEVAAGRANGALDTPPLTGRTPKSSGSEPPTAFPPAPSATPALDRYTIDLTALARAGNIDPVLGRQAEIRQLVDILARRRQNNPILTGDAGVGKTAVVEGLARRLVESDAPPALRGVSIRTLDLGLLQAGAGVKGEFENRLKEVIREVKASPRPVILFIDEAHTMIGAGGAAGQSDAANLLKPALARGELRTIAATTWAEYKEFFEKDAALARRFQVVKVAEPSEPAATEMMRGTVPTFEAHHGVRVLDEAVVEAVRLSHRYLAGRQLPDKCFSVLDTACARVANSQAATPPAIEDCRRRLDGAKATSAALRREAATGAAHEERLAELAREIKSAEAELAQLEARRREEAELITRMTNLRTQLETDAAVGPPIARRRARHAAAAAGATTITAEAPPARPGAAGASLSPATRTKLKGELRAITAKLRALQGEAPLAYACVDANAVAQVIAEWTGIPVGRMVADEVQTILSLRERLERRIVGQPHALEAIARAVRTSRANLSDPRKPAGVFLMVGPSGVGKTETALALAEQLYGGEQNLTVVNMSEFKEEHKVSLLTGAPPGYVGYGKGGVLTEAVRRRPYGVLLLDEMEKAHPGVQDVFYQVFDKGTLRDGEGRDVDFKNTLIVMTSNAAASRIAELCAAPDRQPTADELTEAIQPELLRTFKPAFLGRVTVVPYLPLRDDVMRRIVEMQLARIAERVRAVYGGALVFSAEDVERISVRCEQSPIGARVVEKILSTKLHPALSAALLSRRAFGAMPAEVRVATAENAAGLDFTISLF
jgi:type VI secretion system protein VasG